MRRRPPTLAVAASAASVGLLIGAVAGQLMNQPASHARPVTLLVAGPDGVPQAVVATPRTKVAGSRPVAAPDLQAAAVPDPTVKLEAAARKAISDAQASGADVSFTLLDRRTGKQVSTGDQAPFPIASVAKLFIADDLLMQSEQRKAPLSPQDRQALEVMLQSSDDFAADDFWARDGGNAIIDRVATRYGLGKTTAPYDGNWWNTMSTTTDLVQYYAKLLDGTGGLPAPAATLIVSNLAASKPVGIDGYPQRFGIPDGLFAEPVAVKQGWMCCWNGNNWLHMSTGAVGSDRRYVIAIGSMQPVDDATARETITATVKEIFPSGRI